MAAIATLDELTTELEAVRQNSQNMVSQLRIILDNVDARSDARVAQNRRTIQEQEEQIVRLHSLTRALSADAKNKRLALSSVQRQYMETVGKINEAQNRLNSLQSELATAQGRLATSQHASTGLEQSVRQHNDEIAAIKAREDALRQQQQAAGKLDELRQRQQTAAADLARIQSQVRSAQTAGQGDLASLQQQRDAMQAKLKTLAADVQAGQVGQQRAEATKRELDQLMARKNSVEQRMTSEQTQLAQVQAERRQLQQEVDQLHAQQAQSLAEQTRLAKEIRGINFGHYYALIIGNDEYREWPQLRTAVNDARDLADVLSRKYGFRVQLLTNATKAQILAAINGYIAQLGPSDNLLVYYAGHGVLANNVGYWVPVDAESVGASGRITHTEGLVGHDELIAAMQKMKAKEVMVLADSCFSGGLAAMAMEAPRTELAMNRRLSPVRTRGLRIVDQEGDVPVKQIEGTVVRTDMPDRDVAALSHWAVTPARVVLTSGGLEPVADQMRPGDRHSVFAAAVLASLRKNTGLLKSLDLTSAVEDQVVRSAGGMSQRGGRAAEGFVQTPTYNNLMGYSGQFLFVAQN
jgi:predicted nuclease with TOPRIM domain